MENTDVLLYMGLYSKDINNKDIIAENITADKPMVGKKVNFLLQRADEAKVIPPPATEPVPMTDPAVNLTFSTNSSKRSPIITELGQLSLYCKRFDSPRQGSTHLETCRHAENARELFPGRFRHPDSKGNS
ncbi:MAG: hypothetical protein PWP59_1108 [Sphaerochaeta sp.]|jgi:hypothetical protein|uniref:hypothetical protein n=1 Tax=Sphaerochaeta halotolerans TaxID=2293840 RepID=UPI001058C17D|nr:hypothetical protein [Sphaerochaeta halotolerans]MDN5333846.1 hypothetical protein [Sphaerochaeta sp.]